MGTRAVFTFKDSNDTFSVYKHWDGYPEGAANFLTNAFDFAWKLPRFEAADFAAAFIAANKTAGGNVYLTTDAELHGDLSYHYIISSSDRNGQLIIDVYDYCMVNSTQLAQRFYYGRLKEFINTYGSNEDKIKWNSHDNSENKLKVEA